MRYDEDDLMVAVIVVFSAILVTEYTSIPIERLIRLFLLIVTVIVGFMAGSVILLFSDTLKNTLARWSDE